MKNNHSCQAGQEAAQTPAAAESSASGFNRTRSKLAFDRLVEMGAKMGMENPLFLCHERAAKATTIISGKEYLNFSTYDYLDINGHPEITKAVAEAAAIYGTSAGASRLVGGERPPHRELEQAFAKLYGVEDCIAYVSGHATNVSTLGFLFGHRDAIFHDGLAHNSLVQGARLSSATRYSYAHNDCDALEELLKAKRGEHKRAVIVTEGLFSMDGNIPDLPRIIGEQKPGSVVRLSIWRDRKARDINVTLGEQAGEKLTAMGGAERKGESASGKLGLTGRALTAQEAARLGVPGGVVVEGLGGPAAKAGLQPGDVIIGVNNQPITGIEQFRKLLDAAGNRFALLIQRGGSRIFLPVRIG